MKGFEINCVKMDLSNKRHSILIVAAIPVLWGGFTVKLRSLLRTSENDCWSKEKDGERAKENGKEDERYGD